eukprot:512424_1
MDLDTLAQPLVLGVIIGLVCCCCIVCIVCIYYQCAKKKKKRSTTTTITPSKPSSARKRTGSDLMAIATINHNRELVLTWLKHELSLEQYYSLFIENGYGSMRAIKSIRDKTELAEIGISKKGHQTLIMSNIEHMQREEQNQNRNKTKLQPNKVPMDRKAFNESLVGEWLEHSCNLKQYLPLFLENGFDSMNIIKRIRNAKQLSDIGIHKQGHVILIFSEIENLRNRRKTIDQHVEQVYININKAQNTQPQHHYANNNPYGMQQQRQKARRPPHAQQYDYQDPNIGHGSAFVHVEHNQPQMRPPPVPPQHEAQMDYLPNIPDSYLRDQQLHERWNTETESKNIDGLFGTMQTGGMIAPGSISTTLGMGAAVTTEVIDGQFYNVTSATKGEGDKTNVVYTIR